MKSIIIAFCFTALVIAAPVVQQCSITQAQRQSYLDQHNILRARVANGQAGSEASYTKKNPQPAGQNIKALSWDSELEQWATNWAATCPSGHRPGRQTTSGDYFGENIYWQWSTAQLSINNFPVADAVQAWYDEVVDFIPARINPFQSQAAGEPMTGHYTQVAWASVTLVGCGTALCYDSADQYPWSINIVCNYNGGNLLKAEMYKQGTPSCATNGLTANSQYPSLCGNIDASRLPATSSSTCPGVPVSTAPSTVGTTANGWTNQDAKTWVSSNSAHQAWTSANAFANKVAVQNLGTGAFAAAPTAIFTSATSMKFVQGMYKADKTFVWQSVTTASLSGSTWYASKISMSGSQLTADQYFPKVQKGEV